MKKIISFKNMGAVVAFIAFCLVFNGCKKEDLKADANITRSSDLEKAKAYVQQKSKEFGGLPQVFPVQQKMDVYWGDKNGLPMDPKVVINNGGGCSNFDIPDYTTLLQYQRIYLCFTPGPGYLIQWEYNVSWNKAVVATNANSLSTEGYIYIYDDNGDVFEEDYSVTGSDVVIADLGVDPNNSSNHIYNVKFNYSTPIPTSYINGNGITTYTVRLGATFASDCPDFYALWITPASAFGFTGNTGLQPCDRNDRPIFMPPGQGGVDLDKIGIAGYDPLFLCSEYGSNGFTRTHLQQVEYSVNSGTNWFPFPNDLNGVPMGNPILQYGYIRYDDFAESDPNDLGSGTYNIILRFRNWKYNSVPSPLTIPTTVNGDCHSAGNTSLPSGQQNYATWAYEYHPNITIQ